MVPRLTVSVVIPLYPTARSSYAKESVGFTGLPVLFLGVALLLQVVIASLGLRTARILTCSSSPFDLTAALVHHTKLTSVPIQCMRGVSDYLDFHRGLAKPSEE